jgi:hypothetical protein
LFHFALRKCRKKQNFVQLWLFHNRKQVNNRNCIADVLQLTFDFRPLCHSRSACPTMTATFTPVPFETAECDSKAGVLDCTICEKRFSLLSEWKYRCRYCRRVICATCSAVSVPRRCDACHSVVGRVDAVLAGARGGPDAHASLSAAAARYADSARGRAHLEPLRPLEVQAAACLRAAASNAQPGPAAVALAKMTAERDALLASVALHDTAAAQSRFDTAALEERVAAAATKHKQLQRDHDDACNAARADSADRSEELTRAAALLCDADETARAARRDADRLADRVAELESRVDAAATDNAADALRAVELAEALETLAVQRDAALQRQVRAASAAAADRAAVDALHAVELQEAQRRSVIALGVADGLHAVAAAAIAAAMQRDAAARAVVQGVQDAESISTTDTIAAYRPTGTSGFFATPPARAGMVNLPAAVTPSTVARMLPLAAANETPPRTLPPVSSTPPSRTASIKDAITTLQMLGVSEATISSVAGYSGRNGPRDCDAMKSGRCRDLGSRHSDLDAFLAEQRANVR